MAGMFYSLEEAVAKLNITEEQVRKLAREGKLREFRDGSNVLFKVDEVEALISDMSVPASEEPATQSQEQAEELHQRRLYQRRLRQRRLHRKHLCLR